jgi:hypothetical protein
MDYDRELKDGATISFKHDGFDFVDGVGLREKQFLAGPGSERYGATRGES